MNKILKTLLLGLVIWVIPFLASFLVWDVKAGGPSIDVAWFYALMGFTGAISFSIAAYYQFKNVKKNTSYEGWTSGIIWYIELVLLDFIFLVVLFGMTIGSYSHLLLTYLNVLILSVAIGYLKR
ncbi:Uncharacterised protein [uncultured archaeon]|nr:Uncharacterised protein [uncultured archaeon]